MLNIPVSQKLEEEASISTPYDRISLAGTPMKRLRNSARGSI